MKQLNACIFDLDGVITDTAKYHFIAWQALAEKMGINFTEKDNERLKGVSRVRSLEIILEIGGVAGLSAEEKQKLRDEKNETYKKHINTMTKDEFLPGVPLFLDACRAAGLKLAIGSASKNTPTILARLGLTDFFDAVVDGNSVTRAKPDPEVFLTGSKLMGVSPAETIVFEDAAAGVEAANRGGFFSIGVGSADSLSHARYIISGVYALTVKEMFNCFFSRG